MRRRGLSLVAVGGALVLGLSLPWPALGAPKPAPVPATTDVIVMLRDQHAAGRAATNRTERSRLMRGEQAPVVARARSLGASNVRQLTSVNAVAMTLSSAEQTKLAADPDVASILPDLQLRLPGRTRQPTSDAKAAVASGTAAQRCPTNPARPIHEPEALQTMRVEGVDGSGGAHALTEGAGVTVGFIADGLDPQNPDFQRNGKSVFTDYQDFTTDGPDAPTSGAEAFGDASGIAAQGNVVYDLAQFVNEAHPLPAGCNITVTGVAPGADLVGLKAFGNTGAPTSRFIQAIDYAVDVPHVDVLNESFGSDPFPDGQDDPIALANTAAIRAGVTVVASTGDSGTNGTIGSPASSRNVIATAATTNFRLATQVDLGFTDLPGVTGYANDNISAISSGGFAQNGKVPDVSAPGNDGWAVCSPNQTLYVDCADFSSERGPTGIQDFGGTSQSSPLTAGTAALVIAAYRIAHPGAADPSPALVKRLITSTARDLGHPAELQGSGEVDAHAAVRAALSVPTEGGSVVPASAAGTSLLVDHTQLDLAGTPGHTVTGSVGVTNASTHTRTLTGSVRALTRTVRSGSGSFNFTGSTLPSLTNAFGAPRAYTSRTINVAKGVDRLDASIAFQAPANSVFGVLVDPHGVYTAYSLPQGDPGEYNFAHLDARSPASGAWKLYVLAVPTYSGRITFDYTQRAYAKAGTVTLSDTKLTSADRSKVTVKVKLPHNPGDLGASIQLRLSNGTRTSVPLSLRGVIPSSSAQTSRFTGVITGGNGRGGAGSNAQTSTYDIAVPAGKPNLSVGIKLTGQRDPQEQVFGYLVSPQGQAVGAASNLYLNDAGDVATYPGVQMFARNPVAGRWRVVLEVANPVAGDRTKQPFTGSVSLAGVPVTSSPALPSSAATTLAIGRAVTVKVKVTNTGVVPRTFFADARLAVRGSYTLASQTPGDDQQSQDLLDPTLAAWLVPTRTQAVTFTATSNQPVQLDAGWFYGSPEIYGRTTTSNSAVATLYRPKLVQGPWYAQAGPVGPFTDRTPTPGTVAYSATVATQLFDPAVQTSTGDYWQTALVPAPADPPAAAVRQLLGSSPVTVTRERLRAAQQAAAPAAADLPVDGPLTLAPGKSGTITVQITPQQADRGTTVTGVIDIDTLDPSLGTGDEVRTLPYTYTVR